MVTIFNYPSRTGFNCVRKMAKLKTVKILYFLSRLKKRVHMYVQYVIHLQNVTKQINVRDISDMSHTT